MIGARAIVSTPVEGLNVRVSGYYSPTPPAGESGVRWVVGPALEYLGERLTVRAEYYYHRDHEIAREHTAYAEAAYFVTEHVQLGARAEFFQADLVGTPVKSSLLEHREIAATVNYWFSPQFALKVSGHAIDGNRFAAPTLLDTRCSRGRCRGART